MQAVESQRVVRRRAPEALTLGHDHGLQDVDDLGQNAMVMTLHWR